MLERGEGHPKQAKLLREDGHLTEVLNTRRTAAIYALFRTSRDLEHRMRVTFTLEGAPMYLGDMGELIRELKRFRQNGGSAVLYGGESADALLSSLQDEIRCATADGPCCPCEWPRSSPCRSPPSADRGRLGCSFCSCKISIHSIDEYSIPDFSVLANRNIVDFHGLCYTAIHRSMRT